MARPTATPFDLWIAGFEMWRLAAETQAVVAMRMMGAVGLWSQDPSESTRMITEKQTAFAQSATKAATSMMSGGRPDEVARASMRPLHRKTSANAKRLGRKGPARG